MAKLRKTGRGHSIKVNVSIPGHLVRMAQQRHPDWKLSWLFQEAMAQWIERGCLDESLSINGVSWDDLSKEPEDL